MDIPYKFHVTSSQKRKSQEYVKITRNRVRIIFRKDDNKGTDQTPRSSLKVKIPTYKPTKITLYDGQTIKKLSDDLAARSEQIPSISISSGMPLQF